MTDIVTEVRLTLQPYGSGGFAADRGVDGLLDGIKAAYINGLVPVDRFEATVDAVLRYQDRIEWHPYSVHIDIPPDDAERYTILVNA